ncbi:MAG: hypothetical protein U9R08_01415 [Nanoarchaeota archaeon]|nr:hypothetical protein [Nanoarchaeota archaeon]
MTPEIRAQKLETLLGKNCPRDEILLKEILKTATTLKKTKMDGMNAWYFRIYACLARSIKTGIGQPHKDQVTEYMSRKILNRRKEEETNESYAMLNTIIAYTESQLELR